MGIAAMLGANKETPHQQSFSTRAQQANNPLDVVVRLQCQEGPKGGSTIYNPLGRWWWWWWSMIQCGPLDEWPFGTMMIVVTYSINPKWALDELVAFERMIMLVTIQSGPIGQLAFG
jgi:hypothetical protein